MKEEMEKQVDTMRKGLGQRERDRGSWDDRVNVLRGWGECLQKIRSLPSCGQKKRL